MKANVSFSQIANQLVTIFRSEGKTASYNSANEYREMFCGWCGYMSPLSRPAFVADFGADVVNNAEQEARRIIAEDAEKYAKSDYVAHLQEAEAHKRAGQPTPTAGAFIFAVCSGLKCDGGRGLYEEIDNKINYGNDDETPQLVYVEKVYNVTADEFNAPKTADTLARCEDCPGGWSEEDGEFLDKQRMHWTHAAAVVAPDGRYYLIDNEGYDYARYIYTPLDWRTMFADIAERLEAEKREREEKERREQEEATAARRAKYESKCKKWAKYMTEVAEYAEAEKRALQAHGGRSSEAKAARRKLHSVRRGNIMAMCRAAFPGVKFSVKQHDGWGADWCVTWQDGPTEEEFNKATDLDLFATYNDTFDGMTDSAGTVAEEFTDFAVKYMDERANAVEASREISEERQAESVARVLEVAPELDKKHACGYYDHVGVTDDLATKLQNAFGLSYRELFGGYGWTTASNIARTICENTDYTPRNENEKETTPEQPTAKAEGLQVVDYSEKAVAVIGDTKPHAEKLKELGGRFNARLKCGAGWIFSKKKEAAVRAAFGL